MFCTLASRSFLTLEGEVQVYLDGAVPQVPDYGSVAADGA